MSGMSSAVVCSLAFIVIINVVDGMHLEPNMPYMTCECLTVTSRNYKPRFIQKVEILLPRYYCPKREILVTMKTGNVICINPNAPWVENFLKQLRIKNKADLRNKAKLASTPE